ncbi:MAG TPA: isoprenylcysteine carboxylmethyltransferase family protein [Thermodesulfovibrionia bacterium]|nr:isoprenylcysteine carboxylmethyltransferase family protein [Thermodesulfovibrionia bacterium]
MSITEVFVIVSTAGWPIIPIAWIPMHAVPLVRKKMGLFYYIIPLVIWPPVAVFMYLNLPLILTYQIKMPVLAASIGWFLIVVGLLLFIYTALFIKPLVLIGIPEVYRNIKTRLVTTGPFSVTRNPVYFLHLIILTGIFLTTGVIATLIIAVLDLLTAYFLIIPFEERELFERFGIEYVEYQNRIPRFWPRMTLFNQISFNR